MSKERTSLSLDPEVAQFLQQDHVNASGLVNKLVEQYMNGGAGEDMIRQFRIDQLESELNEIQAREDQKREELLKLKEIDDEKTTEKEEGLKEAKEALEHTPKDETNPAIQQWARDLGMSPQELIEELSGESDE